MTYPYGTRGAPGVGRGIPGLPRRKAQAGSGVSANNVGAVTYSPVIPSDTWVPLQGQTLPAASYPELNEFFSYPPYHTTPLPNATVLPTAGGYMTYSFSPSEEYFAFAQGSGAQNGGASPSTNVVLVYRVSESAIRHIASVSITAKVAHLSINDYGDLAVCNTFSRSSALIFRSNRAELPTYGPETQYLNNSNTSANPMNWVEWTPDSNFVMTAIQGYSSVFVHRVTASAITSMTGFTTLAAPKAKSNTGKAVSRVGNRYAFSIQNTTQGVQLFDYKGEGVFTEVPFKVKPSTEYSNPTVSLHPDGKWLIVKTNSSVIFDLYQDTAGTFNYISTASTSTGMYHTDFTADGEYIYASTSNLTSIHLFKFNSGVCTLIGVGDPSNGNFKQVAFGVDWSPKGTYMYHGVSSSPYFFLFKKTPGNTPANLYLPSLPAFGPTANRSYPFMKVKP